MKVLITGTSRGIGKQIAIEFLKNSHEVIGLDVLKSTIENINYTHYLCNIAFDEFPKIDDVEILINNAGVQNNNDIDVNLKGTIKVTEKYAFQDSIKSVLFIASASAQTGSEFPEYAASKGGVVAYMKNTAQRLSKYQATCNSLSPGGVNNEMNSHILKNKELYDKVLKETLLNKWADVEEIGKWAYFITVVNKSMTGQDVLVDNGEAGKFNFIW